MRAGRDVEAFEERAARYEHGLLGQLHREIVDRATAIALASPSQPKPDPRRGVWNGLPAAPARPSRCPDAVELAGIDPVPAMVEVAQASAANPVVERGRAQDEQLPY
jgi:hypothetical protein